MGYGLKVFVALAAITSGIAEGIHVPETPGKPRSGRPRTHHTRHINSPAHPGKPLLGFLMAGPYGHRMIDNGRGAVGMTYATSFYKRMIEPLLPQLLVELLISSEPRESSAWEEWCKPFSSSIAVRIVEGAPLPDRIETRFSDVLCHDSCQGLWLQYGHLHNCLELVKQREASGNVRFDYIVKARQDVMYKPDNFMTPGWLFRMPKDALAVPSVEFHTSDRWMERTPSMWPLGMNDQIVFGPRSAMEAYLNTIWSNSTVPNGYPQGPESVLSRHIISCNLTVITVELQISRPGGRNFKNGKGGRWVTTPCKLCMVA